MAYWAMAEAGELRPPRVKAKINLMIARRRLERLERYLQNQRIPRQVAMVFLEAQEYLEEAEGAFATEDYHKTFIYSSIVRYLCREVWGLIK